MSNSSSSTSLAPASPASSLSGKARRHLRALGHHLNAVVLVGKDGLTPALVDATGQALADHELIKVKLGENAAGDRHSLADDLAAKTRSELIGLIGRTLLLWKRHPSKPKIELPQQKRPGSATGKPRSATGKPGSGAGKPVRKSG